LKIGIINYGAGNIGNVKRALNYFNIDNKIINYPADLNSVDKIILPGVGAFKNAASNLRKTGLFDGILEYYVEGKYILGICLGMQLLFSKSTEFGTCAGLNILSGNVNSLKINQQPLPHIGWANISDVKNNKDQRIFSFIKKGDAFYFAHSMHCEIENDYIVNYIKYDKNKIVATIVKNNVFGTQFHPELSDKNGLKIFKNFIKI